MHWVRNSAPRWYVDLSLVIVAVLLALSVAKPVAWADTWEPDRFAKEDTLKLCTNVPDEGRYCFPVWLVVIDHQVYVRLGSRAADRFERSTTKPVLGVQIAGQQFERVRGEAVPADAERVAQAMAAKYSSDVFVRWFSHPLTLRLVPE